jgi:hypothetical protein
VNVMTAATQVLLEEGYRSTEELLRGWALMTAMSRLEQYRAESELFEKKYLSTLAEVERATHSTKGQESFEREEDLEDWEFAEKALAWWQSRVEELRLAEGS